MEKTLDKYIGTKIQALRSEFTLTQEALANKLSKESKLDFSPSSISNIENGIQSIYLIDLYTIADVFNKEIEYFVPTLSRLKTITPTLEKQIKKLPNNEQSIASEVLTILDRLEKKRRNE